MTQDLAARLKLTITVMSIRIGARGGGGFQQRPILAIASRMVLTCRLARPCAQPEDRQQQRRGEPDPS